MKLINGLKQSDLLPDRVVATIGNFDGVHRGHQALLRQLRERACHEQCPLLVILFEPQPAEYFRGEEAPVRLMGLREKLHALSTLGVDFVCCLRFNANLAQLLAQDFAEQVIFKSLRVTYLLTGQDFRFGRDRRGDLHSLTQLGAQHGCVVDAFPDFLMEDSRVSSTAIRQALQSGHIEKATHALGRPYRLIGRVITGEGRGRQWGIPTANVLLRREKFPLSGVFSVRVQLGVRTLNGVANMGRRPTIDGTHHLSLEVHLFDFDESIVGQLIHVEVLKKLREEQKFASEEALIAQIHQDIALARSEFPSLMIL